MLTLVVKPKEEKSILKYVEHSQQYLSAIEIFSR